MANVCHISRQASELRNRTTDKFEYKNKFSYQLVYMLQCIKTSAEPKQNVSFSIDNFFISAVFQENDFILGTEYTKYILSCN